MSSQANTDFKICDQTLCLKRYPASQQNKSLQAWDAADEYLIHEVVQAYPGQPNLKTLIFNDEFGALACWFHSTDMTWVTDSYLSKQACLQNLSDNGLSDDAIEFVHGLQEISIKPDLVLIKIPKTLALLEYQLICLQKLVSANTRIIAAGKVKAIHKSTLALFEKHLGPTATSLAKKKARLIFCTADGQKRSEMPYPTCWQTERPTFTLANHANVFSRQSLDIGARFMLQHLPDLQEQQVLVDLGCGNGVLGLSILKHNPKAQVVFTDESYMAIASAKLNVENNLPAERHRGQFLVNDCLQGLEQMSPTQKVDWVLCNPPFHQQNTITDHIAKQMFQEAKHWLKPGGRLQIVANRHLQYSGVVKSLFGGFEVVATNAKFVILSAQKR